jgi:7-cyano-7-deazaguanine synthase in queuosine biosynthesis
MMDTFTMKFKIPDELTEAQARSTLFWASDGAGSFVTPTGPSLGSFGPVRAANADLVRLATLVYAADRSVLRRGGGSNWSQRQIRLTVPVTDATAWEQVREPWEGLLAFLSGDHWALAFRNARLPAEPVAEFAYPGIEKVVLLSGGADSAVGALLAQHDMGDGEQLLFSHVGATNLAPRQREVVEKIAQLTGSGELPHHQIQFSRRAAQPDGSKFPDERSTRTRSLLFIALGLAMASIEEVDLQIPENGFASLNVPLGADQRGSLSTRTTHPHFLSELSRLAAAAGAHAPVSNPMSSMTKGEMFVKVGDLVGKKAASAFLSLTHSCGHTGHRNFHYQVLSHCGVCFGCLLRRASFKASKIKDQTEYLSDAGDARLTAYLQDKSMQTSLASFLARGLRTAELLALNLPENLSLSDVKSLIERGMRELETINR